MKNAILIFTAVLGLASCKTTEQNARLAAVGNLAVTYAEKKGAITPEEAALIRESGKITLAPTPAPVVIAEDVTASK